MVTDPGVRVRLDVVAGQPAQFGPTIEEGGISRDDGRDRGPALILGRLHGLGQFADLLGRARRDHGFGWPRRQVHWGVVRHAVHRRATLGSVIEPTCLFDRILDGSAPAHMVLDEHSVAAFLDARPVFKGHTLVVPREHVETVGELTGGVLAELMEAGRRVAAAQRSVLGCGGTFFALNDIVSQSVPHVHLHVVPRTKGDGLRGFMWPRTRYDGEEEAEATASMLRQALSAEPTGHDGAQAQSGEVLVREAVAADTPRLVELLADGTIRAAEDPSDPAAYAGAVAEIASGPNSALLVAVVNGAVMGMCQLIWFRHLQERGGLCAELESVHVDASMRSRGIGGILVESAVSRAEALGCYRVQLTSHTSRAEAHRFYERHGFEASHVGFKRYLR